MVCSSRAILLGRARPPLKFAFKLPEWCQCRPRWLVQRLEMKCPPNQSNSITQSGGARVG